MSIFVDLFLTGLASARPSATGLGEGQFYLATDTGVFSRIISGAWVTYFTIPQNPPILLATRVLTNAEILALPTTPIAVVPPLTGGQRMIFHSAILETNFPAAPYTNIDADGYLDIEVGKTGPALESSGYIYNDSSQPNTNLDDFLTSPNGLFKVLSIQYQEAAQLDVWGLWCEFAVDPYTADYQDAGLWVRINNGSSGNLTGGDAANTLKISTLYTALAP